jgi:hypothetical protein
MFETQHEGKSDIVVMRNDIETHGELGRKPLVFFTAAEE